MRRSLRTFFAFPAWGLPQVPQARHGLRRKWRSCISGDFADWLPRTFFLTYLYCPRGGLVVRKSHTHCRDPKPALFLAFLENTIFWSSTFIFANLPMRPPSIMRMDAWVSPSSAFTNILGGCWCTRMRTPHPMRMAQIPLAMSRPLDFPWAASTMLCKSGLSILFIFFWKPTDNTKYFCSGQVFFPWLL